MRKLFLVFVAVFSGTAMRAEEVRTVYYMTDTLTPANITPTLDSGYLVVYGYRFAPDQRVFSEAIFSPDGSFVYTIPQHASNVAVDGDGSAAAAVQLNNNRGGIALFDPTGLQFRFIETGSWLPCYIRFAPDHSIWVSGAPLPDATETKESPYFILRHLSHNGDDLGRFLPRSSFKASLSPVTPCTGCQNIWVTSDRIGILIFGGRRNESIWIETDPNGKEIGRWRFDLQADGPRLAPDGTLYAQQDYNLLSFDRPTAKWKPVLAPFHGKLLGAVGDALLFLDHGEMHWIRLDPN